MLRHVLLASCSFHVPHIRFIIIAKRRVMSSQLRHPRRCGPSCLVFRPSHVTGPAFPRYLPTSLVFDRLRSLCPVVMSSCIFFSRCLSLLRHVKGSSGSSCLVGSRSRLLSMTLCFDDLSLYGFCSDDRWCDDLLIPFSTVRIMLK